MKPFPGFIAIEPEPQEEKKSEFIQSDPTPDKSYFGRVVAMGDPRKDEEIICKVGDRVLFNKWVSNELTLDGRKYQFLRVNEILAIVPEHAKSS